jgi:hypothetical protein
MVLLVAVDGLPGMSLWALSGIMAAGVPVGVIVGCIVSIIGLCFRAFD